MGQPSVLTLLAWDGHGTAWAWSSPASYGTTGIWRIPVTGGDPAVVSTSTAAAATVIAIAADVAAGGRVSQAGPRWHWWQPEHLRWFEAGAWPLLVAGLAALLVIALRRRLRLRASQGVRIR